MPTELNEEARPKHDLAGNCWHRKRSDVCMKHEQARGECDECPACPLCAALDEGDRYGH